MPARPHFVLLSIGDVCKTSCKQRRTGPEQRSELCQPRPGASRPLQQLPLYIFAVQYLSQQLSSEAAFFRTSHRDVSQAGRLYFLDIAAAARSRLCKAAPRRIAVPCRRHIRQVAGCYIALRVLLVRPAPRLGTEASDMSGSCVCISPKTSHRADATPARAPAVVSSSAHCLNACRHAWAKGSKCVKMGARGFLLKMKMAS